MGGLIGIATTDKNGLLDKNDVRTLGKYSVISKNGAFLKIVNILHSSWSNSMLEISVSPALGGKPCFFILNLGVESGSKQNTYAFKIGNEGIAELYQDGNYVYVKNLYTYSISVYAKVLSGSHKENLLLMEPVDNLSDGATLIA